MIIKQVNETVQRNLSYIDVKLYEMNYNIPIFSLLAFLSLLYWLWQGKLLSRSVTNGLQPHIECLMHIAIFNLQSPISKCLFPVVNYLLPISKCLLLIANYLLPITICQWLNNQKTSQSHFNSHTSLTP